jgi:hypothetical protein
MFGRVVAPLLALVVALAVPIAQLRMLSIEKACCCPDPDSCHCPSHGADTPQSSIRACHTTEHVIASPQVAAFVAPVVAEVVLPAVATGVPTYEIDRPHAPPAARRPDAPS